MKPEEERTALRAEKRIRNARYMYAGNLRHDAYAWALANIEYIVEKDGMGDIDRILDRIGSGMSTEAALREVLHSDYDDLMQSTAEYLRKTYGR